MQGNTQIYNSEGSLWNRLNVFILIDNVLLPRKHYRFLVQFMSISSVDPFYFHVWGFIIVIQALHGKLDIFMLNIRQYFHFHKGETWMENKVTRKSHLCRSPNTLEVYLVNLKRGVGRDKIPVGLLKQKWHCSSGIPQRKNAVYSGCFHLTYLLKCSLPTCWALFKADKKERLAWKKGGNSLYWSLCSLFL